MPQISPMSWTFILLLLIGFTLLTMSNIYNINTTSLNMNVLANNENSIQW